MGGRLALLAAGVGVAVAAGFVGWLVGPERGSGAGTGGVVAEAPEVADDAGEPEPGPSDDDGAAGIAHHADGDYAITGLTLRLGEELPPYPGASAAGREDDGDHDEHGVRMVELDGVLHDHPVAQAQYGLRNLTAYQQTGDPFFLDRAVMQAQRLVYRRVESRQAWWFPYQFDFTVQGDVDYVAEAPWYSAMAQGQALSLFTRLADATGDARWREAADATFAGFLVEPHPDEPWGTWVDDTGSLWLEEYPRWPASSSSRVLNGHIFAALGLYDYHWLTASAQARELYDGALTTVLETFETGFRRPGWVSEYSLFHARPNARYHQIHIGELLTLYRQTAHVAFAAMADELRADFPAPAQSGTMRLAAGAHVLYRFGRDGRIAEHREIELDDASSAPVDTRQRIEGRGIHLRVSGGPYDGWWLEERAGQRYVMGPVVVHDYEPPRRFTLEPGTYTGVTYDGDGVRSGEQTAAFAERTDATFDASAVVDGTPSIRVADGVLAGHWLPVTAAVTLDPAGDAGGGG